jgi:hypothetical protein
MNTKLKLGLLLGLSSLVGALKSSQLFIKIPGGRGVEVSVSPGENWKTVAQKVAKKAGFTEDKIQNARLIAGTLGFVDDILSGEVLKKDLYRVQRLETIHLITTPPKDSSVAAEVTQATVLTPDGKKFEVSLRWDNTMKKWNDVLDHIIAKLAAETGYIYENMKLTRDGVILRGNDLLPSNQKTSKMVGLLKLVPDTEEIKTKVRVSVNNLSKKLLLELTVSKGLFWSDIKKKIAEKLGVEVEKFKLIYYGENPSGQITAAQLHKLKQNPNIIFIPRTK